MPISGITSYAPTMQQFIDHWTRVNAALPVAKPLLLPGAYTIADFTELRTLIMTGNTSVAAAEVIVKEQRDRKSVV